MRLVCLSFGFFDYTIRLANAISKDATVLLLLPNASNMHEHIGDIDENIKYHLFDMPKHIYYPTNLLTCIEIVKQIYYFKPDVIHLQATTSLVCCGILPFVTKYPLVSTFHDPFPHSGEEFFLSTFVLFCQRKLSNQIIVHGIKNKEAMIDKYKLMDEIISSIQIGEHNTELFKKWETNSIEVCENIVLFFGRIWKYKGLEYLIKAEPIITKEIPDAKIVIAGTGENFGKYLDLIANKEHFIIHNKYIDYKTGAELFQKCSLVVLPYIEASQSGVIPTAYSFKKPVVVTEVGAIPEIVDDGITGLIVPPKNSEALAEAIIKLLKDNDLRERMGENAYLKLKSDLSWNKISVMIIQIYNDAIFNRKNKKESE